VSGDSPSLEELRPHAVCELNDPELGRLGYLVLDRCIPGRPSGGGIRMVAELSVLEVAECARAMTLKWAFLNIPHGGAKCGITAPSTLVADRREDVMVALGRALRPFVDSRIYFTGTDLGTTLDDLRLVSRGLGRPSRSADAGGSTALTVFEAIRRTSSHLGLPLAGATVAVEGFGKVGIELASRLAAAGATLVGVSTVGGALHDPNGLDLDRLASLRDGDGTIAADRYAGAARLPLGELLTLPVDILVPAARTWTIDSANAASVQARAVVPAANAPVTAEAERILATRGVLCFPDFVANCGGVLVPHILGRGFGLHEARRFVETELGPRMDGLLSDAEARGVPPGVVARELAWRNLERTGEGGRPRRSIAEKSAERLHQRRRVPAVLTRRLAYSSLVRRLRPAPASAGERRSAGVERGANGPGELRAADEEIREPRVRPVVDER
jgi:glutamate dehydrogenase (NAD(P)+)